MARIFLGDRQLGGEFALDAATSHHLGRVLRMREGDRLVAVASEREWQLQLGGWVGEGKLGHLRARVLGSRAVWSEPRLRVHLVQGWPKGDRADFVLTAGTQVGIASIWPALTRRSVAKPAGRAAERNQALVRESAGLAGRGQLPQVSEIKPLAEALRGARAAAGEGAPVGVLSELAGAGQGLAEWARQAAAVPALVLVVGPEGGWEEEEVRALEDAGATALSMGPLISRSELAGVLAAAICLALAGDGAPRPEPPWEVVGGGTAAV